MGTDEAAPTRQSGTISTVLTALAGFVAGALLVAVLAFTRHPLPVPSETVAVPMSSAADGDATKTPELDGYRAWPGQADQALTWPFESGTPGRERPPGAGRPDRLSGPDGWTYDPRAQGGHTD
jgi:hypothetical protein